MNLRIRIKDVRQDLDKKKKYQAEITEIPPTQSPLWAYRKEREIENSGNSEFRE